MARVLKRMKFCSIVYGNCLMGDNEHVIPKDQAEETPKLHLI